jgi:hypothetical protein
MLRYRAVGGGLTPDPKETLILATTENVKVGVRPPVFVEGCYIFAEGTKRHDRSSKEVT